MTPKRYGQQLSLSLRAHGLSMLHASRDHGGRSIHWQPLNASDQRVEAAHDGFHRPAQLLVALHESNADVVGATKRVA